MYILKLCYLLYYPNTCWPIWPNSKISLKTSMTIIHWINPWALRFAQSMTPCTLSVDILCWHPFYSRLFKRTHVTGEHFHQSFYPPILQLSNPTSFYIFSSYRRNSRNYLSLMPWLQIFLSPLLRVPYSHTLIKTDTNRYPPAIFLHFSTFLQHHLHLCFISLNKVLVYLNIKTCCKNLPFTVTSHSDPWSLPSYYHHLTILCFTYNWSGNLHSISSYENLALILHGLIYTRPCAQLSSHKFSVLKLK